MTPRVIIIGGGISGLATAFYLKQRGVHSIIIEASGRLGGLIQTDRVEGCDLEAGPDSFISTKPAVAELAAELGISDRLMGSNDTARRIFVVKRGNLTVMPKGMVMMVPSDWESVLRSPLFSISTKARFVREYFAKPRLRDGDFSISDLMLEHFGEEALQYLTEPLLSGVYGGNAAALSARSVLPRFVEYERSYGSLIKGVRQSQPGTVHAQNPLETGTVPNEGTETGTVPNESYAKSLFLSFRGGMQTLIDSLVAATQESTEVHRGRVEAVRENAMGWEVQMEGHLLHATQVVLACSAQRTADLVSGWNSRLAELLSGIPYSSSILVTFVFKSQEFTHPLDGFGFLIPPPERKTIAAATWINTKFPSRMASGFVGIRTFLVDPEADHHSQTPDDELVALALQDLRLFMRIDATPVYSKVYRWPKSMPQYIVGHSARVSSIEQELRRYSGLQIVSNYLDGVGIPDCVRNAKRGALQMTR